MIRFSMSWQSKSEVQTELSRLEPARAVPLYPGHRSLASPARLPTFEVSFHFVVDCMVHFDRFLDRYVICFIEAARSSVPSV